MNLLDVGTISTWVLAWTVMIYHISYEGGID
jgi:hypothetical protein